MLYVIMYFGKHGRSGRWAGSMRLIAPPSFGMLEGGRQGLSSLHFIRFMSNLSDIGYEAIALWAGCACRSLIRKSLPVCKELRQQLVRRGRRGQIAPHQRRF